MVHKLVYFVAFEIDFEKFSLSSIGAERMGIALAKIEKLRSILSDVVIEYGFEPSGSRLFHVDVAIVEVTFPVIFRDVVSAGPDVVCNVIVDRSMDRRHFHGFQRLESVQTVHFSGMICSEILSSRIGPSVFHGTGHVQVSRGDCRQDR